MAYAKKGKEVKLNPDQIEQLRQEIGEYETQAQNYREAGDMVSAAGIYKMISKYDPKRYQKLREDILKELDEKGDTEQYAIIKGSGDKKEATEYANRLYKAGRKNEAAYTAIASGNFKYARKILAELSLNAKDGEAADIAMRLIKGKEAKQMRIAELHEAQRARRKSSSEE